ncbi:class I SAM-dependent methyltransferase [Haloplasma contractile]|uniref:Family 2 glycosyl transferase protein n=1 Tax=Haloplasma contractile SSD-17B TaxID=1033810 RepID=U2E858_9MOLU|nr:class I SAM-dependent methyltransferase [Haloplasma contractile]ERJ11061.1 family 2 glycosyl transferase protein [Haloplasma contractile SSD-17B]
MRRFWESTIKPIISNLDNIKHIVEVGSDRGYNTENLAKFCNSHGAKLTVIDPFIKYEFNKIKDLNLNSIHLNKISLEALKDLKDIDVILLDGDHNWYTVYNELCVLNSNNKFPLIFAHDVGWPYDRRDLYYNPNDIPDEFTNDYEKAGMILGFNNLFKNKGLNTHLYNSIERDISRCGVLTAIEDFCNNNSNIDVYIISGFHDLAIIYDKRIYNYYFFDKLIDKTLHMKSLEKERLQYLIKSKDSENTIKKLKSKIEQLSEVSADD